LGLVIASRLVAMMGGQLRLDSAVGQGSTFQFTAAFKVQPDLGQAPTVPAEPEVLRGLRVLVVDDNATNRQILEEMLGHWGARPTVVESGPAALDALERASTIGEPFRLILLDGRMPQMDGFDLAGQIRIRFPASGQGGVILMMLSSAGKSGDASRCRNLGITEVLTKPIRQANLSKAILKALGEEGGSKKEEKEHQASASSCPLNILLAEDNPINQKLAISLLAREGHRVVLAGNGEDALQALEREQFDLVLMDVQMPKMDGLQATATIRENEWGTGRHIPIVAMTAYAQKGDREQCLAAGMDGYIAKPINRSEFLETVARYSGRQEGSGIVEQGKTEEPNQSPIPNPQSLLKPAGQDMDWSAALAEAGGDRQLLAETAALFLEEYPRWLADLRAAIDQHDPARVQRAAHGVKGGLTALALEEACASAFRLEVMGRQAALSEAEQAWAALKQSVDRVTPMIGALAAQAYTEQQKSEVRSQGSGVRSQFVLADP
jgi:CheY-like chemotaxis protein